MKIVMPIAGRGSRFKEAGYSEPKPLIPIRGKPMVKWATDCISFKMRDLIFICLKEHDETHQIADKLRKLYSDEITVLFTDGVTEGAACTVLLARDLINVDEDLIIYNSDQYFRAPLSKTIKEKGPEVKGIIPVFYATHPKWSYAKVDEGGYVVQVAEKVPISTHATVGLYYFTHGKDFVWAAEEMIKKNIRRNNEFYVCPVYNQLIERGDKIIIAECDFMWGLGTPEDVEHFTRYHKD